MSVVTVPFTRLRILTAPFTVFLGVTKLKIRRGGREVVDDIPLPSLVPSTASTSGVTILQTPKTTVGSSSFISTAPVVTSETPSASSLAGPAPSSKNSRQSSKRKAETDGRKGAFCTPVPPPVELINIGFRGDKLDPTVLGKLPVPATIEATSVHTYWTSAFEKAIDNAELMELLKLAEMYTSQSHVLNCELYKVLAMKVDELRSTVGGMKMLARCVQKQRPSRATRHFRRCEGTCHI
ncbi:hypothetical protein Fot_29617 [Forsythia ovata]|uniref:Uncharacterized protein n=1 Tax=Forsythia ovata TaxID=205694 RepID=A0ABD1TSE0_9LAMI